jgi:hypothetical protein
MQAPTSIAYSVGAAFAAYFTHWIVMLLSCLKFYYIVKYIYFSVKMVGFLINY